MRAFTNALVAALCASVAGASGIPVDLYHDNNCTDFWKTETIQPGTCYRPGAGFSSMMIKDWGETGQFVVRSEGECAGSPGTMYKTKEWHDRCAGFDTCNSIYFLMF